MKAQLRLLALILLMTLVAATAAQAQWPSDPAENLALTDREGEQTVPKIAATSDGGAYVGWYDHASGNYDVYLQRLNGLGHKVWGQNGFLVSGHRQDTWVMEWHLIADSDDNAVLVFGDIRDKRSPSVHAYRVSRTREMLWGPDGITLSATRYNDLSAGMRVVEASDGDFVFIWTQWTTGNSGSLMMQRVSPDGVARFEEGGIAIVRESGKAPAFPDLVPAEDGGVIVSWLDDNALGSQTKFLLAQKFGADGGEIWPDPVMVFDAYPLSVAYKPEIYADGAGGTFLAWHYPVWLIYNAAIQHLDADGKELFPHNGVTVSTDPVIDHYYPNLSHDPATGEIYVFFREYDAWSGLYGIYGQRFSPEGERLWGNTGMALIPLSLVEVSPPLSMPVEGESMVFWMDRSTKIWTDIRVLAMRVDGYGKMVWSDKPLLASTYPSAKGDLQLAADPSGKAMLVWDDHRNDAVTGKDIYGQNVNADGTLGN